MSDITDTTKEWNQNILRNLKSAYPNACEGKEDKVILQEYDDYSRSGFGGSYEEYIME